jgi:hypothetical protein
MAIRTTLESRYGAACRQGLRADLQSKVRLIFISVGVSVRISPPTA